MNLRLIVLGTELLRITTQADDALEADDYDSSGYTASTPIGYAPSQPTGWDIKLPEPGWEDG